MQHVSPTRFIPARRIAAGSTVNSDSDGNWFGPIAQQILGSGAGYTLHAVTQGKFPERTCYRYVAGDTQPSAYFLRALLRSSQGAAFLDALMEGCEESWWLELKRARKLAHLIKTIDG